MTSTGTATATTVGPTNSSASFGLGAARPRMVRITMNETPITILNVATVIPNQDIYPRLVKSPMTMWKIPPRIDELGGARNAG